MNEKLLGYLKSLVPLRVAGALLFAFAASYFAAVGDAFKHIDPNQALTVGQFMAIFAAPVAASIGVAVNTLPYILTSVTKHKDDQASVPPADSVPPANAFDADPDLKSMPYNFSAPRPAPVQAPVPSAPAQGQNTQGNAFPGGVQP